MDGFIEYLLTTIMLARTLIVVSVPEGLPMSVTLSLALSMRRMLATNNLVRKMHACETMGANEFVICTDKDGMPDSEPDENLRNAVCRPGKIAATCRQQ